MTLDIVPNPAIPTEPAQVAPLPHSWPTFGGGPFRNMVNVHEKNLPADWSVEPGNFKNIKWSVHLKGGQFASPVVAAGKVFLGSTQLLPTEGRSKNPALLAFRESDGKLIWQNVHDFSGKDTCRTAGGKGVLSTPTVEGRRIYYVTPSCEVICASTENGEFVWKFDAVAKLGVSTFVSNACSPLLFGDLLFVNTGTGRDWGLDVFLNAKAPSFIAIHKDTGALVWQSNLPGLNIVEGQISNPTLGFVDNKPQIIFASGDAVIYSFEPATGRLLWKCDCFPNPRSDSKFGQPSYFVSTPVVVRNRLYIGLGALPNCPFGFRDTCFLALDITKHGDVSIKSFDVKDPKNAKSALVWAFGGLKDPKPANGRSRLFGRTMSTAAVHDGLVHISEENGYLHCLDAETGQWHWTHDVKSCVLSSPLVIDSRVVLAVEDGTVFVFAHEKEERLLAKVDMEKQSSLRIRSRQTEYSIRRPTQRFTRSPGLASSGPRRQLAAVASPSLAVSRQYRSPRCVRSRETASDGDATD